MLKLAEMKYNNSTAHNVSLLLKYVTKNSVGTPQCKVKMISYACIPGHYHYPCPKQVFMHFGKKIWG